MRRTDDGDGAAFWPVGVAKLSIGPANLTCTASRSPMSAIGSLAAITAIHALNGWNWVESGH